MEDGAERSSPAAETVKSGQGTNWTVTLTAAATILGAFFAAGQTLSQVVQSWGQHKIELEKGKQEIKLNQQKSDGALASEFLKMINDKETSDAKRIFLLNALSSLTTHPLQRWAATQSTSIKEQLDKLDEARERQLSAFEKTGAQRDVQSLQAELEIIGILIHLNPYDVEKTNTLQLQRQKVRERLALTIASVAVLETKNVIAASPNTVSPADAELVKFQLPIEKIKGVLKLPAGAAIYDKYMPFVASGLVEFRLTEKKMVAAIVATAAHETASFSIVTNFASGAAYEGRTDLGNTQPGDGRKYRGRGLIQIIGRNQYVRYGAKLNVNLVDFPEDANAPDIAARVLCAYFKEREGEFATALANSNLEQVRRLVNGGLNGYANFSKIYADVLSVL